MPKKTYKTAQREWKIAHYGMTHEKWNKWNREWRKVRPLVLERDNNTCQICKVKSDKLFIMIDGKIALEGKGDLVDHLEERGYGWIMGMHSQSCSRGWLGLDL